MLLLLRCFFAVFFAALLQRLPSSFFRHPGLRRDDGKAQQKQKHRA
jgi:hypothetical protein